MTPLVILRRSPQWLTHRPTIATTVVVAIASVIGLLISRGSWLTLVILLIPLAVALAIGLSVNMLAALLAIAAMFQIPLVGVGGPFDLGLTEIVVPSILALMVMQRLVASHPGYLSDVHGSTPGRLPRAIHLAVGAYGLVLILNLVRSKYVMATPVPVNHAFYEYLVVAIGTYAAACICFTSPDFDWRRFLGFLYYLALIVCIVGLVSLILHLSLNLGNPRYSVRSTTSGAVRIGFLDTFGLVGFALAVTAGGRLRSLSSLLFLAALVASGGRSVLVGALIAAAIYLVATRRSWQLVAAVSLAVLLALLIPTIRKSAQAERLSQVNPATFAKDRRQFLYDSALDSLSQRPVLGTGVGAPVSLVGLEPELAEFYEMQLELGGHATYATLLKNLGLLGLLPFLAALALGLTRCLSLKKAEPAVGFFLIVMIAKAISMIVEGAGADPLYFMALAGAASVSISGLPQSAAVSDEVRFAR